jgi:drug/metabolite transporter (DMT)-like permease
MILFPVLLGILVLMFYGVGDFLQAKALRRNSVMAIAFWVEIVGSVVLTVVLVFLILSGSFSSLGASALNIALLIFAGLLASLAVLAWMKGVKSGYVSVAVPFGNAGPVVTVILGLIILTEKLASLQLVGIAIILFGALLASSELHSAKKLKRDKLLLSVKYGLLATLGFGLELLILGVVAPQMGWFLPIFVIILAESIPFFIIAYLRKLQLRPAKNSWRYIVAGGALPTIGFLFYGFGAALNYTLILAPVISASSMITVILALVFLGERLKKEQLIGIFSIILGLVLISL